MMGIPIRNVLAAWLFLWLSACAIPMAEYNLDAYKNATTTKAQTEALVAKSGERYALHVKDVDEVTLAINSAYEFAAGLPSNQLSAEQWNILRDPEGGLYGEFIATWKRNGTTSPAYRREKARQMNLAFDEIICLEANKKSEKSCLAAQ